MAIFTAVRNKKQTAGTMMGVLKYVTQACKTMLDDQWMVTGHNCVARASYLEMMTTKQQFRKTDGRQFYHFVQSFPAEDGLTPQQVNAIGVEFAQKQFPDFEVVVATHLDTNHLHNHLVVNSVSCKDGKKLHQNAADLQRHRQVNDEICMAHGLQVLEPPKKSTLGKSRCAPASTRRDCGAIAGSWISSKPSTTHWNMPMTGRASSKTWSTRAMKLSGRTHGNISPLSVLTVGGAGTAASTMKHF